MQYRGRLNVAGDRGEGIPVLLTIDDIFLNLMSDGEDLGTWRLDAVEVRRAAGERFQLVLAGEEMTFSARDPLDFAYTGVSAIEEVSSRLSKRRFGLFRRRPKSSRPPAVPTVAGDAVEAEQSPAASTPPARQPMRRLSESVDAYLSGSDDSPREAPTEPAPAPPTKPAESDETAEAAAETDDVAAFESIVGSASDAVYVEDHEEESAISWVAEEAEESSPSYLTPESEQSESGDAVSAETSPDVPETLHQPGPDSDPDTDASPDLEPTQPLLREEQLDDVRSDEDRAEDDRLDDDRLDDDRPEDRWYEDGGPDLAEVPEGSDAPFDEVGADEQPSDVDEGEIEEPADDEPAEEETGEEETGVDPAEPSHDDGEPLDVDVLSPSGGHSPDLAGEQPDADRTETTEDDGALRPESVEMLEEHDSRDHLEAPSEAEAGDDDDQAAADDWTEEAAMAGSVDRDEHDTADVDRVADSEGAGDEELRDAFAAVLEGWDVEDGELDRPERPEGRASHDPPVVESPGAEESIMAEDRQDSEQISEEVLEHEADSDTPDLTPAGPAADHVDPHLPDDETADLEIGDDAPHHEETDDEETADGETTDSDAEAVPDHVDDRDREWSEEPAGEEEPGPDDLDFEHSRPQPSVLRTVAESDESDRPAAISEASKRQVVTPVQKPKLFGLFGRRSSGHQHDYQEAKTVGGITRRICAQCGHVSFEGTDVYDGWT